MPKTVKNFNVWPSELFHWVADFLIDGLKNDDFIIPHRWPAFSEMYKNTEKAFYDFFEIPDDYSLFFTYSATEGMDILIEWVVDDSITHISNWDFWDLFSDLSKTLQKDVNLIKNIRWSRVEVDEMIVPTDVLALTANDTSTWVEYTSEDFKEIRNKFSEQLILVDATSSFWALYYDISSADAWLFSVQKNLWLPSGLGLLLVNDKIIQKAWKRQENWVNIWGHHNILSLNSFYSNYQTPSTPNIMLIQALAFVIWAYKAHFWDIYWLEKYTLEKAEYFYSMIEKIDTVSVLNTGKWKSKTTFVLDVPDGDVYDYIFSLLQGEWYSVSPGYWKFKEKNIRVANFPIHSRNDIEELFKVFHHQ